MERRDNILDELKQVSAVVAGISRNTPFEAPTGYFEGLAGQVLQRIRAEESAAPEMREPESATRAGEQAEEQDFGLVPPLLLQINKRPPFTVPEGYFEGFAEQLLARVKAGDALPGQRMDNPLEELAELSPLLSRIDKKTPFTAPGTYFGELTDNVLAGVLAIDFVNDELENLSPLMNSLKGKNTYQAPEGYFDSLAGTLLAKVKEAPGAPTRARVIPIGRSRTWLKYSAAAAVIGLLVMAGWLGFHQSTGNSDDIKNIASKVSDQEIVNYLDNQNFPLPESGINSTAALDLNDSDINDMLADVSDAELKKYLEQHTNAKDQAIN